MKLDNRWVVPYNPYLLLKYNAHINVEIFSTVSAVKYLYKYVYRGHDRAIIELQSSDHTDKPRQVDEVSNYLELGIYLHVRLAIEYLLMITMLICHM